MTELVKSQSLTTYPLAGHAIMSTTAGTVFGFGKGMLIPFASLTTTTYMVTQITANFLVSRVANTNKRLQTVVKIVATVMTTFAMLALTYLSRGFLLKNLNWVINPQLITSLFSINLLLHSFGFVLNNRFNSQSIHKLLQNPDNLLNLTNPTTFKQKTPFNQKIILYVLETELKKAQKEKNIELIAKYKDMQDNLIKALFSKEARDKDQKLNYTFSTEEIKTLNKEELSLLLRLGPAKGSFNKRISIWVTNAEAQSMFREACCTHMIPAFFSDVDTFTQKELSIIMANFERIEEMASMSNADFKALVQSLPSNVRNVLPFVFQLRARALGIYEPVAPKLEITQKDMDNVAKYRHLLLLDHQNNKELLWISLTTEEQTQILKLTGHPFEGCPLHPQTPKEVQDLTSKRLQSYCTLFALSNSSIDVHKQAVIVAFSEKFMENLYLLKMPHHHLEMMNKLYNSEASVVGLKTIIDTLPNPKTVAKLSAQRLSVLKWIHSACSGSWLTWSKLTINQKIKLNQFFEKNGLFQLTIPQSSNPEKCIDKHPDPYLKHLNAEFRKHPALWNHLYTPEKNAYKAAFSRLSLPITRLPANWYY